MKKKGFSLVEILVVTGLIAATSLVTLKMVETQQGAVKYTEVRLNELELYRQIQLNLAQRTACKETFVTPYVATGGLIPTATGIEIPAIYKVGGAPLIKVDNVSPDDLGGFIVSKLTLSTELPAGGLGNGTLKIYTERTAKGMPKTQEKKMAINLVLDAGVVKDCYMDEDQLMKSMCEAMDGDWDDTVSPPKCLPNALLAEMCIKIGGTWDSTTKQCTGIVKGGECPDGQMLMGYDNAGNKVCKGRFFYAQTLSGGPYAGGDYVEIRTYNIPGTHLFCALSASLYNPHNQSSIGPTHYRCNINPRGANLWELQISRNRRMGDIVRCEAVCF